MTRIKVAGTTLAVLLLAACTPAPANARPWPTPGGSPGPMLLIPRPGAYCPPFRHGKRVVIKGKTYVCKGPKPYRWRLA